MEIESEKPLSGFKATLLCLAIVFLLVAVTVGLLIFFAPRQRAGNMQEALRHYEEAQKIKAPPNVDEAGIRALVNDLLPGGKDQFAERKLRLLGQRAVPALVSALDDPRFLQKPKSSNSLFEHAPLETVLNLLEPFTPPEAVAPLIVMLGSPDKYVRQDA